MATVDIEDYSREPEWSDLPLRERRRRRAETADEDTRAAMRSWPGA